MARASAFKNKCLLRLALLISSSESDGGVNGSVRCIVVVGIAVVADIADVRGVAAIDGQQPPVAPSNRK